MDRTERDAIFNRALGYYDESRRHHGEFVQKVEKRYKAYRGVIEEVGKDDWRSYPHPPYIMHIVETTLASLIEPRRRTKVKPRLTVDMLRDPGAAARAREGARYHQILHDWQGKQDKLRQLERPFSLQNGIASLTVAKTFWRTDEQRRRRVEVVEKPVIVNGEPMLDPSTGAPLIVPQMHETTGTVTVYDGPTTEVRDVRDFGWHEAAIDIHKARYVWDRVWMSFEDIERGLEDGAFGPEAGGDSEKDLRDHLQHARDFKDEYNTREQDLFSIDRTKDLIEVVEVWDNLRGEVTTIANRKGLLSHRPFPFWHEQPPFTVCSTQPDLFSIPGISQVEKIADLQQMLWDLQRQRLTNLELINNAIFLLRADEEFEGEFEPGAQWLLEDPASVQMWTPNVIPAEVAIGAEGLLKGDLQNLAGGFPFSSGADSQTVDQKTATGASIVTSLAQRSISLYKEQLDIAWEDIATQRMLLNQQFVREVTVVPVAGPDGEDLIEAIEPEILAGEFMLELEASSDAFMKQEEQASAQALIQLAQGMVQVSQALAAAGQARPLNWDAFVEDLLRAFGKEDVERYFSQAAPLAQLGAGGAQAPPGAPGEAAAGVTGPGSIDPAVSPSSAISMSPATLMQRAQALSRGGGQNV